MSQFASRRLRPGRPMKHAIIVGTGGFGAYWCSEILPSLLAMRLVRTVAAVDRDPESLRNAQQGLGLPARRCYTDLTRALAENSADFLIIVVPPSFHETVVDTALAHDLDILSEKPIADTIEGTVRIFNKVQRAGRKMAITMSHRMDQDKQTWVAAIASGRYGRLHYIVCRHTHNARTFGSWGRFRHEMQDPLLIEGAVHYFDTLRAAVNSEAKVVFARSWNPPWGEYAGDSVALVTIDFENGVHAAYEGSMTNASSLNDWGEEYFRAECEEATIELDHRRIRILRNADERTLCATDVPILSGRLWSHLLIANQFVDWLDGGPTPATSLEDNINSNILVFAAVQSARTGLPVMVRDFAAAHMIND